jgi:hypothetical protein
VTSLAEELDEDPDWITVETRAAEILSEILECDLQWSDGGLAALTQLVEQHEPQQHEPHP